MIRPNGETLLIYNIQGEKGKKLRMLSIRLGMKIRNVSAEDYGKAIGELAGLKDVTLEDPEAEVETFEDEMMVMKGFTSSKLDLFLQSMRKAGIGTIDYKAILTPVNSRWNSWQLYQEIKKEHEEMHGNL